VYWKKENGGTTRENLQAWCLECFANNFEVPSEAVTLLSLDVVDYARLVAEDQWRAVTFKDALRDASRRAARERGGSIVLNRADDDVLLRLDSSLDAVEAARNIWTYVRDLTASLQVGTPTLRGGIHRGDVTTWRNGLVVGDAVKVASRVRDLAGSSEILLTRAAADPLHGKVPLEAIAESPERAAVGPTWSMRL